MGKKRLFDQCNLPTRPPKWSEQVDQIKLSYFWVHFFVCRKRSQVTSTICLRGLWSSLNKLVSWNLIGNRWQLKILKVTFFHLPVQFSTELLRDCVYVMHLQSAVVWHSTSNRLFSSKLLHLRYCFHLIANSNRRQRFWATNTTRHFKYLWPLIPTEMK